VEKINGTFACNSLVLEVLLMTRTVYRLSLLLHFCLCAGVAQTVIDLRSQTKNVDYSQALYTKPVKVGTALPATCSPGEMFFQISGPLGQNLFGCIAQDVWVLQGNSSASNVGSSGIGLFDAKAGSDFQFRSLNAASNRVMLSLDAANRKVDLDVSAADVLAAGSLAQLGQRNYSDLLNIPTTLVQMDRSNTYVGGVQDFGGAAAFRVPVSPGLSLSAAGQIGYDSASSTYRGYAGAASKTFAFTDSNITGNAATATALSATPAGCPAGQYATAISSRGDLTCSQIGYPQLSNIPGQFAPAAHAASHKHGGSDEIATAVPAVNAIPKADASGKLASGWVSKQIALADLSDVASKRGNSTQVQMTTGNVASGDCAQFDVNGNVVSAGAPCGGGSGSLTIQTGGALIGARPKLNFAPGSNTTVAASDNGTDQVTVTIDVATSQLQTKAEKNVANGYAGLDTSSKILSAQIPDLSATYQAVSGKNATNGYAGLDATARIAKAQAPDVAVYTDAAQSYTAGRKQTFAASATTAGANIACGPLPSTPATGDIACDSANSNALKIWNGSAWVQAGGSSGSLTVSGASIEDIPVFNNSGDLTASSPEMIVDLKDEFPIGINTSSGSMGNLPWRVSNITTGTCAFTFQASVPNHPLLGRLTTGAASGNDCIIYFGGATAGYADLTDLTQSEWDIWYIYAPQTIANTTIFHGVQSGLAALGNATADGIWLRYIDGIDTTWTYEVRKSGTSTTFATTTAPAAGTFVKFHLWHRLNGGNPTLYLSLNDGQRRTWCASGCDFAYSSVPVTSMKLAMALRTNTASAASIDMDYFRLRMFVTR
jgi:hypothetical protein